MLRVVCQRSGSLVALLRPNHNTHDPSPPPRNPPRPTPRPERSRRAESGSVSPASSQPLWRMVGAQEFVIAYHRASLPQQLDPVRRRRCIHSANVPLGASQSAAACRAALRRPLAHSPGCTAHAVPADGPEQLLQRAPVWLWTLPRPASRRHD